jgi:membrane associated rhomboid family serine protease
MAEKSEGNALGAVIAMIGLLWLVFGIQVVLESWLGIPLSYYGGVRPHEWWGLVGLVTSHLLHAGLAHIIANSTALFILGLVASAYSRPLTRVAVVTSAILAGITAWIFGAVDPVHPQVHIGASGVAFGLMGFLLGNGIFRRSFLAMLIAIAIGFLFGGAILGGLVPQKDISWQMHAGGFAGGVLAAWFQRQSKG